MSKSALRESLKLLGTRRFGTFWFASLLSSIGTWAQQVAQPWLLLSIGASAMLIGLDSFAMSAPVWLLTLVGGMLADRFDRRRTIAWFQPVQMLCPIAIVVLLLISGIRPWMIISLSLIVGITDALFMPSFSSIVQSIVEKRQIDAGPALNSTQFNISRIAGPALAGVLICSVGAMACFAVSAVSYLPFFGVALWILPRGTAVRGVSSKFEAGHHFEALRTLAREPFLRGALLTALFFRLVVRSDYRILSGIGARCFLRRRSTIQLGDRRFRMRRIVGCARIAMRRCAARSTRFKFLVRCRLRFDAYCGSDSALALGSGRTADARWDVDEHH